MSAKATPLEFVSSLVAVDTIVWGPRGVGNNVKLIVDTGAAMTTIKPNVLDEIGYGARMGESISSVSSVVGTEYTYTLRVARLSALGFSFERFLVNAADLATHPDIDGLLGLDFLRQFDTTFQFSTGRILLDPIAG